MRNVRVYFIRNQRCVHFFKKRWSDIPRVGDFIEIGNIYGQVVRVTWIDNARWMNITTNPSVAILAEIVEETHK